MSRTTPKFEPPIVVQSARSYEDKNIKLRVDFLCSDGELCIPFTIGEDELRNHREGWKVCLNLTREELKQRLLLSLQTMHAREMLDE